MRSCPAAVRGLEDQLRAVFYTETFQLSLGGRTGWCWWESPPLVGPQAGFCAVAADAAAAEPVLFVVG